MNKVFGKNIYFRFALRILLVVSIVTQIMIILYFNIFEADIHLGIDSSWDYLKTMVVGKMVSIRLSC